MGIGVKLKGLLCLLVVLLRFIAYSIFLLSFSTFIFFFNLEKGLAESFAVSFCHELMIGEVWDGGGGLDISQDGGWQGCDF